MERGAIKVLYVVGTIAHGTQLAVSGETGDMGGQGR
jgi:hypothetical protein